MNKPFSFRSVAIWICLGFSATAFGQAPQSPGPEHARLKSLEGNWDARVKFGDQESKATSTFKMGCGGMWLISDFQGDFGGAPFEGRGLDGYDLEKKKYVSVWVDSMTSSIMTLEGSYDEKSKTLTMMADGKGPDGKPVRYKNVTTIPDKNHQTFKMYMVGPDGKDNLMMTIEYTRKGS